MPGIHQAELVPGHVDGVHLAEPEVPLGVRVQERPDEAAARGIHVQRDVETLLALESDKQVVDSGMSSECPVNVVPSTAATPMVFSSTCGSTSSGPIVYLPLKGHDPRLDVEVAAELLPDDVDVAAEDEVRPVGRLAGGLAPLAPVPLQGQGTEHDRLRGALGPRADRLAGGVEEVGKHPDAALLDLGGPRVLGVIDEVAVEVLRDDPLRLGLHPGGHEGGEVALRIALERQVLRDQAHRLRSRHALLRELHAGNLVHEEPVSVAGDQRRIDLGCVLHHGLLSSARAARSNSVHPPHASLERGDMPTCGGEPSAVRNTSAAFTRLLTSSASERLSFRKIELMCFSTARLVSTSDSAIAVLLFP